MYNKKAIKYFDEGRVLQQKGKLANAERAYKRAIKINPDFVEAYNNLGNVLLDRGQPKEAFNSFRKANKLLPNNPNLLLSLGNTLHSQGEIEKAIGWYNKAIIQDPGLVGTHVNLGNAFRDLGRFGEAVAAYKHAIQINPDIAEIYNNLGNLLIEINEIDEAVVNFKKALEIDSRNKNAYQGLGNALGYLGEIENAIGTYRKAIETNPKNVEVYRSLSRYKKFSEYDDDIRSMETLYAIENISDVQKMHLAFGLGKAYEDLGKYEKSMEFILEAARLKRASIVYSISESEQLFSDIKATFSPEFFADSEGMGNQDPTPIFILGMPRSGTSLVEQILASHPDVFGAGELNDLSILTNRIGAGYSSGEFPAYIVGLDSKSFEDFGIEYVARLRHHSKDTRYVTDKMPHNFIRIGLIKVILPNARIIHCTRDPMDNCLSIFKNYFAVEHHYSYDMTELGRYYNLYLDLLEYWRNILPGFIYDLSYELLVTAQEKQIKMLLDSCKLSWHDACLDFHKTRRIVKTASKEQVRHPIYKDSLQLWKRYEKQLEPLRVAIYG